MSYMRSGWDLKWVEGISKDYVYPTEYRGKTIIEDCGELSKKQIVEVLKKSDVEKEIESLRKELPSKIEKDKRTNPKGKEKNFYKRYTDGFLDALETFEFDIRKTKLLGEKDV